MSVQRQAATEIASRLHGAGHIAWFAGGCVRDELLGMEPKDYDVATDAVPEEVQRLFPRAVPVGAAFGVMLVRHLGASVEVATFREESGYSDRRRPDHVSFSDARADAGRRDFTINGLFSDPQTGEIHDFVEGRADLDARVLRAIGNADQRLDEDHLRMLRAVRFIASLGVTLEAETEAAIKRHAAKLCGVSRERVGDEVRRILRGDGRLKGLDALESLGLGAAIFGSSPTGAGYQRVARVSEVDPTVPALLAAWAMDRTAGADEDVVAAWRAAMLLTNDECAGMTACLRSVARFRQWADLGVAARKRLASTARAEAALAILSAEEATAGIARDIEVLAQTGLAPARLINGDALISAGMQPGPGLGAVLEQVYDAQLEGRVSTQDEAMALARALGGEGG
ncbi:MAG: CCA tRNA nucleotidyltransferase [Phycisphaerales bacterium]|jgi:tRNA nucleotidyltransferase/poly(A) polymerase|nr:CCA tRNA nucleotidyltransferase [Phycisphaerales bacterium]